MVVAVDIDLVRVSGREVIIGGSRLGDLFFKTFLWSVLSQAEGCDRDWTFVYPYDKFCLRFLLTLRYNERSDLAD